MARNPRPNAYDGFLVVDKDRGPTSHDVVAILRRMLDMRRIGHCGTLDPLASGVLVVCLGSYTRLSDLISSTDKEYESTFVLGSTSETGDAEGPIVAVSDAPIPSQEQVVAHIERFRGEIDQVPHAFSAVKINGTPSYRLARRDEAVELHSRQVRIDALDIKRFDYPEIDLRIICSKGTYIRSLAADLGASLGCGGYVKSLRRVRVGRLDLPMALTLDAIDDALRRGALADSLVDPRVALAALPQVTLAPAGAESFSRGCAVPLDSAEDVEVEAVCAVFIAAQSGERLAGIGKGSARGEILPVKVLIQSEPVTGNAGTVDEAQLVFSGVVEHGAGRGAELGIPTANLRVDGETLLRLPRGVFAANVRGEEIGDDHMGVVNIGTRPTFTEGVATVELHIFDFSGDVYGKTIEVSLHQHLRDERRFESVELLVSQLHQDVEDAKRVLGCKVHSRIDRSVRAEV